MEGQSDIDFFASIVADAEAGFGGVLNAFELMKNLIDAGASGVHFEDHLASVEKCAVTSVAQGSGDTKLRDVLLPRVPERIGFTRRDMNV